MWLKQNLAVSEPGGKPFVTPIVLTLREMCTIEGAIYNIQLVRVQEKHILPYTEHHVVYLIKGGDVTRRLLAVWFSNSLFTAQAGRVCARDSPLSPCLQNCKPPPTTDVSTCNK